MTTTASQSVLSSTVTKTDCRLEEFLLGGEVEGSRPDTAVCDAYGVYLRPTPLGPVA